MILVGNYEGRFFLLAASSFLSCIYHVSVCWLPLGLATDCSFYMLQLFDILVKLYPDSKVVAGGDGWCVVGGLIYRKCAPGGKNGHNRQALCVPLIGTSTSTSTSAFLEK